jgi:hypothetical protein
MDARDQGARLDATLTLICTDDDGHPSDQGNQALADAVLAASDHDLLDARPGS